ncbi:hypothetical protein BDY21DRAFT_384982 [Lineolata rhizophorae]|uniref:Folliculin-interacting protein N-terminal domain-containing protein n=1 Tax=Lineolata rhizophorae TaxID=578093 RepID=A0A6A6P5H2_9PEZI|nr:hypothetical protein BDY21DRAFT_384982 [Lineolata rhizophorae]
MLGRLLHSFEPPWRAATTASSSSSRPIPDSATDDAHTRSLLFPDSTTSAFFHPHHPDGAFSSAPGSPVVVPGSSYSATAPATGPHDGVPGADNDIDPARDVRIVVAQDEAGTALGRCVLFDSKPGGSSSGGSGSGSGSGSGGGAGGAPPGSPSHPPGAQSKPRKLSGSSGVGQGGILGSGGIFGAAGGAAQPGGGGSASAAHSRRSSLATSEPQTPRSPGFGVGGSAGGGGSAFARSSRQQQQQQQQQQAAQQARASREADELVNTCLDCMFSSYPLTYKGPGNKLHIIPLDQKVSGGGGASSADSAAASPVVGVDGAAAFSRGAEARRRRNLARSYTPGNPRPGGPQQQQHQSPEMETPSRDHRRRTVLITRTFTVSVPEEEDAGEGAYKKVNGVPISQDERRNSSRPKHRVSPTYAITVILQLPVASSSSSGLHPRSSSHRNQFRGPGSAPGGQDSLCSSYESDRKGGGGGGGGGLSFLEHSFSLEPALSASFHSDVDNWVDVIGQHWDVIARTLTSLQFALQECIFATFKGIDASAPPGAPRSRIMKLQPHALMFDAEIRAAMAAASERIVRGIKIPRVVTGQGRWGVWREEARWLSRWAGGRDQNFFFYNVLTAFLGNHLEWLSVMGPRWHRRRYHEQQRSSAGEDLTIASRTVIVAQDKMAARRLIFLLSAFLPAQHVSHGSASPARPSTSASLRAYSQSPPMSGALSRQQSLRRTINRRGKGSHSTTRFPAYTAAGTTAYDGSGDAHETPRPDVSESHRHSRRPSDARSIFKADLPLQGNADPTKKSSAGTTSTVTPTTAPVPHFTIQRSQSSSGASTLGRPESGSSLASDNLMHALNRQSSTATTSGSQATKGWGSFVSFWSGSYRRSSSSQSDIVQSTDDDGLGIAAGMRFNPALGAPQPRNKLERMDDFEDVEHQQVRGDVPTTQFAEQVRDFGGEPAGPGSPPSLPPVLRGRPIPARQRSSQQQQQQSPLRMSVNSNDGIIDVDIPIASFGSPLQSPLYGFQSTSSLDGSGALGTFGPQSHNSSFCSCSQSLCSVSHHHHHHNHNHHNHHHHHGQHHYSAAATPSDPHPPRVSVAGWLSRFHPDFALQGVGPYAELEADVRRAMSAEPTPVAAMATGSALTEPRDRNDQRGGAPAPAPTTATTPAATTKWVDVCSALIADARSFTIKRIRLRRLVKLIPSSSSSSSSAGAGAGAGAQMTGLPIGAPAGGLGLGISRSGTAGSADAPGSAGLAPAGPVTEVHLEEQFAEEALMDFDGVLADAVERVVARGEERDADAHADADADAAGAAGPGAGATAGGASAFGTSPASASAATTPTAPAAAVEAGMGGQGESESERGRERAVAAAGGGAGETGARPRGQQGGGQARHPPPPLALPLPAEVPKAECKALVLGALEAVVRGVVAEKERGGVAESTLREGVRRWLGEVEGWERDEGREERAR